MKHMEIQLSKAINVRVDERLYDLVNQVARDRGEDVSDFVRRTLKAELARLSFLSPEEKKALGIKE